MAFEPSDKKCQVVASDVAQISQPTPVPAVGIYKPYATFADFLIRFQSEETRNVSQAKISNPLAWDQPRVETGLLDASGLIDSYLRARFSEEAIATLHGSPSPELILHSCNITRYQLASNRATELMRERYEDAIQWCEHILKDNRVLRTGAGKLICQKGDDSAGEDGVVYKGVVYRAETYTRNKPLITSSSRQVEARHWGRRSRVGHRRWHR